MFDSESSGTAKGSLKDRLRVLNILLRISRRKKLRLKFGNINSKRILNTNKFFLFFHTPTKIFLNKKLNTNNVILYQKSIDNRKTNLIRKSQRGNVSLSIIKPVKKKGIDLPNLEETAEVIKAEIVQKYNISPESVDENLIKDYQILKNNAEEIFDMKVSPEIKEALIIERIKANNKISELKKVVLEDKDSYLGKDIEYDIKTNAKQLEKLNKSLEKEKKRIEIISRKINDYVEKTEKKYRISNLKYLIGNAIGIGLGILTLPFSYSKTFVLGLNLIDRSIKSINKNVKINSTTKITKSYTVGAKDIEDIGKSLKSADFLLDDVLESLDHLKYKIKYYEYKIPEASKRIKEIEALESGLSKKKRDLKKIVESFEKNKVKVLNRDGKSGK